ncbi:MAG: LysR family transcriptional regulator [Bacillota bacterium]|nr:LysR family transcriptional regulator [Bacillota bacterium]
MKLEQLYYFQEAVKYRSISVAAKQNYASQSSFSSAISKLEQELGAPLLRRTNAGVEPTEFGWVALDKAETIFQAQQELLAAAQENSCAGIVNLRCVPGLHRRILTAVIPPLEERYPSVVLSVSTGESRRIASAVSSGTSAIGIVVKGNYLTSFRDLTYTPLFREDFLLYAGRNSPLWGRKSVTWQQVQSQIYIGLIDSFQQNNEGGMTDFLGNFPPTVDCWSDDPESIKKLITQSDRAAIFPRSMADEDPYLLSGILQALTITGRDTSFEAGYLTSTRYRLSPPDQTVIQILNETVAKLPQED